MGLVPPEVLAGAAPSGLHLVGDEQDPAVVELLAERAEQPVGRRREAADALDRLGDHAGHVARRRHVEHLHQIVEAGVDEGVVVEVAEGRPQPVAAVHELHLQPGVRRRPPRRVRRDRLRREHAAVVAVADREDLVGLPVRRREQERGVVRLAARRREVDAGVGDPGHLGHHLGELDHRLRQVQRRRVQDLRRLGLDRRRDGGVVVPDHRREHTTEEVEVRVTIEVVDVGALAVVDRQRLRVVRARGTMGAPCGSGRRGRHWSSRPARYSSPSQ